MLRNFISLNLANNVRVWTIERLVNNTTVINHWQLESNHKVEHMVVENDTAYKARIKNKLKEGYVEVDTLPYGTRAALNIISEAVRFLPFKEPMKCQKYVPSKDNLKKLNYPCAGQPKFNGVRCYILWGKIVEGEGMFQRVYEGVILVSNGGNRYKVDHISNHFTKDMFCSGYDSVPDIYYDGELYVHGEQLNTIKSRIPIEINGKFSKPSLTPNLLSFYCFDTAVEDIEYKDRRLIRYDKITNRFQRAYAYDPATKVVCNTGLTSQILYVDDTIINNEQEAQEFADNCIKAGYEGAVFRDFSNIYRYGQRPADIIKVKRYDDGEFVVTDIIPKPSRTGCLFVCKNDINDHVFESNPEGSHQTQLKWLADKDKIIGSKVTIKFYERSGVKKCPFHSNVITVRDYE